ncbi:MAG: hypothetical protein E4H03_00145 [Myxococcales bacterium]|nr:MAG: hypothetical protein E4H03_00145 [Myxococcales bacterium]
MNRTAADALDGARTEKVLARLGFDTAPPVTLVGLAAVYDAWCRNVPFDNVRKLIHVRHDDPALLPGDDPADFFDAWLSHGCGGTCWAGNGALHALLTSLGFSAQRVVATMMVAPNISPNHGSVVVNIEGGDFIVDASILHIEPLPMRAHEECRIAHAAWGVTGIWVDGQFRIRWRNFLTSDWMDCGIDTVGAESTEFASFHELTRVWSPFNFSLSVNSIRGNSRIGAALGKVMTFDERGEHAARPVELPERRRFLVEEVGMSEQIVRELPDDIPITPPPGARS